MKSTIYKLASLNKKSLSKKIITPFLAAAIAISCQVSAQTAAVKKVLLEEFTTTLCGMCPPKSHNVNKWHDQNAAKCVMMTHHAGFGTDAMTTPDASTTCSSFQPNGFGYAPAIMIDRDVYPWLDSVPYMTVNGFDSVADRVSKSIADVSLDISGTYQSNSRALNVSVSATFVNAVASGAYNLYVYLIEDSVIGNGSGYDQKCYDSNFANTYYPGQFSGGLISQYPHRVVERKSLGGGTWGISGLIPNSPVINSPYSTNLTFNIPANYNDSRLYIVAFVAKHGSTKVSREVLNANDIKVKSSFSTSGATSVEPFENSIEVNSLFPNPVTDFIGVSFSSKTGGSTSIWVTDITGRIAIQADQEVMLDAGKYQHFMDVSTLNAGIYFLVLKTGNGLATQKFIVER